MNGDEITCQKSAVLLSRARGGGRERLWRQRPLAGTRALSMIVDGWLEEPKMVQVAYPSLPPACWLDGVARKTPALM